MTVMSVTFAFGDRLLLLSDDRSVFQIYGLETLRTASVPDRFPPN